MQPYILLLAVLISELLWPFTQIPVLAGGDDTQGHSHFLYSSSPTMYQAKFLYN